MKRIFWLTVALLCITAIGNSASAQRRSKPRSVIQFSLSDGSPLTIAVNDRYYKKIGNTLTLGDLPGKRPYIKVYQYRPYADGKGGKAELVFSGTIKIKPGTSYTALIDISRHQLILNDMQADQAPSGYSNQAASPAADNAYDEHNTTYSDAQQDNAPVPPATNIEYLKQQMDAQDADLNKLNLAKQYVDNNTCTVNDISDITASLLFDDTKLSFLKYAYDKVSDKNNYNSLASVFDTEESKAAFNSFLASQR